MGTNVLKISNISILSGTTKWSSSCAHCWKSGGQWKNIIRNTQVTTTDRWKFPIERPSADLNQFGVDNGCHIETRVLKIVRQETPSKSSRSSSTGCKGSADNKRRDNESRTVMVLSNGMYSKLCEELEDDGALPFGYIFLVYLETGGEHLYHLPFDPRVWILLSKKILWISAHENSIIEF